MAALDNIIFFVWYCNIIIIMIIMNVSQLKKTSKTIMDDHKDLSFVRIEMGEVTRHPTCNKSSTVVQGD